MSAGALHHRLGTVLETTGASEQRGKGGRTKRYLRCRMQWDDGGEPEFYELTGTYAAGDRTALILRDNGYICDVNLSTGFQSTIGDRLEGVAALLLFISVPLSFVLIGIPIYLAVTLYSKVTSGRLRRQVAAYVTQMLPRVHSAQPQAA